MRYETLSFWAIRSEETAGLREKIDQYFIAQGMTRSGHRTSARLYHGDEACAVVQTYSARERDVIGIDISARIDSDAIPNFRREIVSQIPTHLCGIVPNPE
ncbi:hypothetical protein HYT52_00410 [Candidatus Woesearchaeota archaeon]|nr:hypothetical protein [Candidatus Woesearchaeota archaeon]